MIFRKTSLKVCVFVMLTALVLMGTAIAEVALQKMTSDWQLRLNSSMGNKQIVIWSNDKTGDTKIRVITSPIINDLHAINPDSSSSEVERYYDIIINRDEKSLRTEGKITTPVKLTIEEYSSAATSSSINMKAILTKKDGLTSIFVIDENEKILQGFIPYYSSNQSYMQGTESSSTTIEVYSTIVATSSINTFLTKDGLIYAIDKSGKIIQVAIPDGYNLTDGSRSLINIDLKDKRYRMERRRYDKGGNLIELGYDTYKVKYKYSPDFFPRYPIETEVVPNIITGTANVSFSEKEALIDPKALTLDANRSTYLLASELFNDWEFVGLNLQSNSKIYVFLYTNFAYTTFYGGSVSVRYKDEAGNVIALHIAGDDAEDQWFIVMKGKNYSTRYIRPSDKNKKIPTFQSIPLTFPTIIPAFPGKGVAGQVPITQAPSQKTPGFEAFFTIIAVIMALAIRRR